jgi:hypothetical protein
MMRRLLLFLVLVASLAGTARAQVGYLGFDRNEYPGDSALPALRKTFRFTSYWLNTPPEARGNSWVGKRALLKEHGFGFLVLFNGRLADALGKDPAALGSADGKAAAAAAEHEGFERGVLIFLDQEEGGRLTPQQVDYLFAWVDAVRAAGDRAGVYCSGITIADESGMISTVQHIAELEETRTDKAAEHGRPERLAIWVANDQCPPSPGCTVKKPPMGAGLLHLPGVYSPVWQYAQSPRRAEFTAGCQKNYAPDNNCYAPGMPQGANSFIDLNVAESPDPSEAR